MSDDREKLLAEKEKLEYTMEEVSLSVDTLAEELAKVKAYYKSLSNKHERVLRELAGQQKLFN